MTESASTSESKGERDMMKTSQVVMPGKVEMHSYLKPILPRSVSCILAPRLGTSVNGMCGYAAPKVSFTRGSSWERQCIANPSLCLA